MSRRSLSNLARLCVLALFVSGIVSQAATGAVLRLEEVAEGNGNDSDLDGAWDVMEHGPLISLLAYNGGSTYNWRAALEFDIRGIQRPADIDTATLLVSYGGASGTPALTLQFNGYAGNGTIELKDFEQRHPVGPRYNAFGPGSGSYYRVPVTEFIQSLVDGDKQYAGFMIENLAWNQTALGGYYALQPPRLEISYHVVPEPSCLALWASAGLLLCRRARH